MAHLLPADAKHCLCATSREPHAMGKDPSCEYFEHHCDSCHSLKVCTKVGCLFDGTKPPVIPWCEACADTDPNCEMCGGLAVPAP